MRYSLCAMRLRCIPAFLLFAVCAFAQAAQRTLVITHVTVIDGTGRPPMPDRTVVIRGKRIIGIGNGVTRVSPTATFIDGRGKFLIPGLWDMHVHVGDEEVD